MYPFPIAHLGGISIFSFFVIRNNTFLAFILLSPVAVSKFLYHVSLSVGIRGSKEGCMPSALLETLFHSGSTNHTLTAIHVFNQPLYFQKFYLFPSWWV